MNDYKQVEAIFRKGFDAGAKPTEELKQAHTSFGMSMSRRLLYDDDGSKQQFQATMEEKRTALTSLRAHKKKFVGSLRTGIAVRDENPGIVNQENVQAFGNVKLPEVHEDEPHGAAALPANTSVIRSIIDSARKKENLHEPGPWTKAKTGKHGGLFGKTTVLSQPGFNIMEDDSLPPLPCPVKTFELGINLPPNHITRNGLQKPWDVETVVQEAIVAGAIPCYEKFLLYPDLNTEISADEYRAYKWFKDRGMIAPVTKQYECVWVNRFETKMRIPPGFAAKNFKQDNLKVELFIDT
jgi:checkpoint serine/threonine-protein kinase